MDADGQGDHLNVCITDCGCGFPQEALKHAIDGVRYGIADLLAGGMPFEEQVQADYAFLLGR